MTILMIVVIIRYCLNLELLFRQENLNNLQSILQNQIEKFGQHFFKEGAKVIPGNTGYNKLYYCIQLQNNFQGVPVSAYV